MRTVLARLMPVLQPLFTRWQRWGWQEAWLLLLVLLVVSGAFLFINLADEVREGDTQKFDERVLRSLRQADDPAVPIGPPWVREAGLDATALGSPVVLVLVVIAVLGFLLLLKQFQMIWLTLITTIGGILLSLLIKDLIERPRPSVVPHLREVSTPSFPSGHAMLSAIVYLTLGILLTQVMGSRLGKIYCLLWAIFLTFLVGMSRAYLGVHYPTDVLAGWMAGLGWALACWLVAQYVRHRRTTGSNQVGHVEENP